MSDDTGTAGTAGTTSEAPDGRYTLPFWKGLADGRLRIHDCAGCGEPFFPPAPVCPRCGSREVEWTEADGRGRLYSVTRQHATAPGFPAPLVVGLVALAEGPRLLAPVAADFEAVGIGTAVRVVPVEYDHGYDRGPLAEFPYFEAVPVEDG
jgi:hypothetical protein